jgi:hypothetical protein
MAHSVSASQLAWERMSVFTCATVACCSSRRQGRLLANTQSLNDRPIPRIIDVSEIVQQSPSAADKLQQSAPRMMILLMELEMVR